MAPYYKLPDKLNYGEIVKKEALNEEYQYSFGEEKWYRSSIMLFYRRADNDEFGQYEEITEREAEHILGEHRKRYDRLPELAIKVAAEAHKGQTDKGGGNNRAYRTRRLFHFVLYYISILKEEI